MKKIFYFHRPKKNAGNPLEAKDAVGDRAKKNRSVSTFIDNVKYHVSRKDKFKYSIFGNIKTRENYVPKQIQSPKKQEKKKKRKGTEDNEEADDDDDDEDDDDEMDLENLPPRHQTPRRQAATAALRSIKKTTAGFNIDGNGNGNTS